MLTYQEFADKLEKEGELCTFNDKRLTRIGEGIGRATYTHPNWPFLVFKYEYRDEVIANASEWEIWHMASDEQRKFMAKPFYLSKGNRVLVMERVGRIKGTFSLDYMEKLEEMFNVLGTIAWDADNIHNIGPSGTGPKIYDYADEYATFFHEDNE